MRQLKILLLPLLLIVSLIGFDQADAQGDLSLPEFEGAGAAEIFLVPLKPGR